MFDIYVNSHRMFNIMSIYALEAAWNDGFSIVGRTGFRFWCSVELQALVLGSIGMKDRYRKVGMGELLFLWILGYTRLQYTIIYVDGFIDRFPGTATDFKIAISIV